MTAGPVTAGPLRVAIVGCGTIARQYLDHLGSYPELVVLGVTDLERTRAEQLAAEHGCRAYPSLDALLDDDAVEAVVNLTIPHAHVGVTERCLAAGRHVYSEKPLALAHVDALRLVELADERGVRLGCSPSTLLGEAQQTAWRQVREGLLGTVRLVHADVNQGRIEAWHPEPESFYEVGPLYDVGVYPLTLVTSMLGPARRVSAAEARLRPDRTTLDGRPFRIRSPDYLTAAIELEGGILFRLTTNYYAAKSAKGTGIELHGDAASLFLGSWQRFDAAVELAPYGEPYRPVPLLGRPYEGTEWGRGVREFAQAIASGRPHRTPAALAAHVVEVASAITESARRGRPVDVTSRFEPPAPLDWAT